MNESVLVVEDEEGIRNVLSISIADAGYEVHTAENGIAFGKNHDPNRGGAKNGTKGTGCRR